jgi:hypothetical protein
VWNRQLSSQRRRHLPYRAGCDGDAIAGLLMFSDAGTARVTDPRQHMALEPTLATMHQPRISLAAVTLEHMQCDSLGIDHSQGVLQEPVAGPNDLERADFTDLPLEANVQLGRVRVDQGPIHVEQSNALWWRHGAQCHYT